LLDRRSGQERLDAARHYPDRDEVDWVRVALRAPSVAGLGFDAFGLTFDRPGLTTGSPGLTPGSPGLTPGSPGLTPGAIGGSGASVKGRSLANHWIEATLEPTGALALHDRRTGERFFDVLRLEDGGDAGDTYTYCPPARDCIVRAAGAGAAGSGRRCRRGGRAVRIGRTPRRERASGRLSARDAGRHRTGAPLRRGGGRATRAGAARARVLRVRVDVARGPHHDAAAGGGRAVTGGPADAPRARRVAHRHAAGAVPRPVPRRARARPRAAGRGRARRCHPVAVGGRLSSGAWLLAARRGGAGAPVHRHRARGGRACSLVGEACAG